jgi:peptidoglycan/LPS O-acetylase OafA/YrhL
MLPPKPGTYAHANLDLMRGIAALLVLIQHTRQLLLLTTSEVPGMTVGQKAFYFLTSLGGASVMVFFVLSGFLVGASVIQDFRKDNWSWRKYLSARLARIYTVLLPVIIIGTLLDVAGNYYLGTASVYALDSFNSMYTQQIITQVNVENLFGNLLHLQGIMVPTLGSNGPLWSMAYEAWYYLLFPLLFSALYNRKKPAQLIFYLALTLAIFAFIDLKMSLLFLVWLMGAALVFVPRIETKIRDAVLSLVALVGIMAIGSAHLLPQRLEVFLPYVTGALSAVLIYAICCLPEGTTSKIYAKLALGLPSISFTLYLCHVPFVVLCAAIVLGDGLRMLPDAQGMAWVVGISGLAIAFSTLLWFLFERHTGRVKLWLFNLMGRLAFRHWLEKVAPPNPKT